jgi:cyclophilin family peptidyl-prolyl cis-trans isomerase
MTGNMMNPKCWAPWLCALTLAACGPMSEHSPPHVTDIQAQNLYYKVQTTFSFLGDGLVFGLKANIPNCSQQVLAAASITQQAITCTLTAVGDIKVDALDDAGNVLFSKTFTVPHPTVALTTSSGAIVATLDPAAAPNSVDNFLAYVQSGFYANSLFHRVIPNFVIQGGGFSSGLVPLPGLRGPVAIESNNGLKNLRGSLAMARTSDPNSATSQFYFNLVDNPSLDYVSAQSPGYTVFGKITQGLDVMDAIGAVPTTTVNGQSDVPVTDVVVSKMVRIQ